MYKGHFCRTADSAILVTRKQIRTSCSGQSCWIRVAIKHKVAWLVLKSFLRQLALKREEDGPHIGLTQLHLNRPEEREAIVLTWPPRICQFACADLLFRSLYSVLSAIIECLCIY